MSLSYSVSEGSYANIIRIMTNGYAGHFQIHREGYIDKPSFYDTIAQWQKLEAKVKEDGRVTATAPRIRSSALAFSDTKASGVQVLGIDPAREITVTTLNTQVDEGVFLEGQPGTVLLGAGTSDSLKLGVGDSIFLISQGIEGSIANDVFTIVGIVGQDKSSPYRNSVIMDLATTQNYLSMDDQVHELAGKLDSYNHAREFSGDLESVLLALNSENKLDISPWQIVEEEFYRSMEADKAGNVFFVLIITLVVGLGVLNSVLMSTLERMQEFGLMRAMGTRPKYLFFMIVFEAFALSLTSICIGLPLAWALSYYLQTVGIDMGQSFDIAGQQLTKMYGEISQASIVDPAIVVLFTAMVVAVWPAWRAAKIIPVEALHKS